MTSQPSSFRGYHSIQPATRWQDALPVGNGVLAALMLGHIRQELIVINHEGCFLPRERHELPDISRYLPEMRAAMQAGQWQEGERFVNRLGEAGYVKRVAPFHPAADLVVEMLHPARPFTGYRRQLDFESGEALVTWEEDGVCFTRRLIASRPDDAIVNEITAGAPIHCRFQLRPHDFEWFHGFGTPQVISPPELPIDFTGDTSEEWLTLTGRYRETGGEFGVLARVVAAGGTTSMNQGYLEVHDATRVIVLMDAFANEPSAPALQAGKEKLAALPADYGLLFGPQHTAQAALFNRCRLELGDDDIPATERLLLDANETPPGPAVIRLLHDMGRYLLISSCRSGSLPPNLQGKWNGDWAPAWDSDYHNDENIQMNYWQALPGNLPELVLPYAEYYRRFLEDYRLNAKHIYGCRGILAPIAQTVDGQLNPGVWAAWTAGAGWLAQLLYDHWLFTGDRGFLAQYTVPFLLETALFYEDFLAEGADGCLHFLPSLSPENVPATEGVGLVTTDATMDAAVAREVFGNLCAACAELDVHGEDIPRWQALRVKLPPYRINADGALAEWLHPALPDNYHHRHQSHIYPFFPGIEITPESDPSLFQSVRTAIEKRLVIGLESQTGWSLAHMANIWARLGEGEKALECLRYLFRACTGPNLFTYHNDWRAQGLTMFWGHRAHPPYQIDAILGATAAVLEMLVYATPGIIRLLPAVPADWEHGAIHGLLCRGGISLDLKWNLAYRQVEATFRTSRTQSVIIRLPGAVMNIDGGFWEQAEYGPAYAQIDLSEGETTILSTWK